MRKNVYINGTGHMTKMVSMPIYGKNLLQNQKSYDLSIWHVALGTQALQSYINDDPGLTLTYFNSVCTDSRPRYQVSVYRTIGPLVLILLAS